MPVGINGQTYYRTTEVCKMVGISKSTLFRWIKQNLVSEAEYRDRRGWRLFKENELHSIIAEGSRIKKNESAQSPELMSILK
jgi:excisionase family DNA binding protein